MRNIFKKYYEMSKDTKEILGELYMIHELESLLPEYEELKITTLKEEEIIAKSAIECWYYSNIDGGEIVGRILNLLECEEITIEDLETMEIDELKELISEDKADFEENTCKDVILSNFIYKDYNCVFFKDKERLILTFEKNDDVDVCIFNSLEEMLAYIVNSRLKVKGVIIE